MIPWNKDKKLPEFSNRMMGENNPMFQKPHPSKGKPRSYTSGENHPMFGKSHPSKGKPRLCMSGENHPNWKGGTSCEPYCDIWLDQDFKESIMDRDGNICLNPDCWNNSKRLTIHHINYKKKDCRPKNLITICNSCNTRANSDREWHESWYNAIIFRRGY